MRNLDLTRAAYALNYVRFFEKLGTPVERELERALLPIWLEEFPDAQVSMAQAVEFRDRCAAREQVDDLGWHLHKDSALEDFSPDFAGRVGRCRTLWQALKLLQAAAVHESNFLTIGLDTDQHETTVSFNAPWGYYRGSDYREEEWNRVFQITALIQHFTGKEWRPDRVSFISRNISRSYFHRSFSGSALNLGQARTSLSVSNALLASPNPSPRDKTVEDFSNQDLVCRNQSDESTLISSLKSLLLPYLSGRQASINLAAKLTGMSTRSLQRALKARGYTYSSLLDECRFEHAAELLSRPEIKINDIAYAAGYENHAHFTRAFRRVFGTKPSDYRKNTPKMVARQQDSRVAAAAQRVD